MGYQRPPPVAPASARELFGELIERNFIYNAVTLRRSAVDAVGPPDSRLRSSIDWEWWLRLSAHGHRAVRVPGRLAVYRLRAQSMTLDRVRVATGQRDLLRIAADEYPRLSGATRSALRARADRLEAERAALAGGRSLARGLREARHRAASMKTRLLHRRAFFSETPPEVRAAFGDLRDV